MHGADQTGALLGAEMRPRILDRSVVQATPTVASRLGVEPATPCLRYEYVALVGDEPIGPATNYVLFPEASRLLDVPFNTHWYQLLDAAGMAGVPEGSALLLVEQLIRDADGRPWDLAFFYVRTDRFVFVSRSLFNSARVLRLPRTSSRSLSSYLLSQPSSARVGAFARRAPIGRNRRD
jgi:DNA-binding GntR family transcriptional regulator